MKSLNVTYLKLASGCYQSKDGRVEINKLPDGCWAWGIDGVGYDAENTLQEAKLAVIRFLENEGNGK